MDGRFKRFVFPNSDKVFEKDLRKKVDDRTVLENPHKGFYVHYVDNGLSRTDYRTGLSSPADLAFLPGCRFLYLRFDWADLEPRDGQYDWSYLDHIMDTFGAAGYKFMFRFCTMEGSTGSKEPIPEATPAFVYEAGAASRPSRSYPFPEPVYDDPVFKRYLARFLGAVGQKLDGDSRVESIDIGTFGTFGEAHTYGGSETVYPKETLLWHIDAHLRAFPHCHLVVNDDMLTHRFSASAPEDSRYLTDYCISHGIGIRDDSINVPWYEQALGYNTLRAPGLFERFRPFVPVDIEFEHYRSAQQLAHFNGGYRHIEALRDTGATYCGFHGDATVWYSEQKPLHDYLANRLGYWYIPDAYTLPPLVSGLPAVFHITLHNAGFARAYYPYTVRIRLVKADQTAQTVFEGDSGNVRWLPAQTVTEAYRLDLCNIEPGEYTLQFGLFEGDLPIRLALSEELYQNGYYALDTVLVSD